MSFQSPSNTAAYNLDRVSRSPFYEGLLSFESIGDGPRASNQFIHEASTSKLSPHAAQALGIIAA